MLAFPKLAWANTANLTWVAPAQYEDGSVIGPGEIKNFKIYYGNKQGGPYQFIVTVSVNTKTVTIENLPNGTWYFVATAISSQDAESEPSVEGFKTINVIKKPKAPTSFTVR